MANNDAGAYTLFYILLWLGIYFLPTIVAAWKKKKNGVAILLTNLFFGWTVLGWFIALIWAAMKD